MYRLCGALLVSVTMVFSANAAFADWGPWPSDGTPFVAAGYKHDDGGALVIICNTKTKLLSLLFEEPRATWQVGETKSFMARPDSGQQPAPSKGRVIHPTRLVVETEATWDIYAMGQATTAFAVGAGDYARIFPAPNFRKATDPVLRACGDHW